MNLSFLGGQSNFLQTYRHPRTMEEASATFRDNLDEREKKIYLKLTGAIIFDYKQVFDIFDADESGAISNYEIGKVMNALGEQASQAKIEQMIASVDFDNDHQIEFDEFVCLMVKKLAEADDAEEELVKVFNRFDKDGDGEIGVEDLIQMMTELGYPLD